MPVYSRKSLRQQLGRDEIRDTLVGNTTGSWGATASLTVWDSKQANLVLSGQGLYHRAWLKAAGTEYRIATWNTGSGAWQCLQTGASTVASGVEYEVHTRLAPSEKDRAIDDAVKRVRVRREVPLWTVNQARVYSLGDEVEEVYDATYFGDPAGSLTRDEGRLAHFEVVQTATGRELRIDPALEYSKQIVLDALVAASLGAADTATVSLPDDRWVLAGAAAKCYDLLARGAPAQEGGEYRRLRDEAGRRWRTLAARFQPESARRLTLADPYARSDASDLP